jgi:hypothetical protein
MECEPAGTRTRDHRIKSAMLYQLSYRPALGQPNSEYHSDRLLYFHPSAVSKGIDHCGVLLSLFLRRYTL